MNEKIVSVGTHLLCIVLGLVLAGAGYWLYSAGFRGSDFDAGELARSQQESRRTLDELERNVGELRGKLINAEADNRRLYELTRSARKLSELALGATQATGIDLATAISSLKVCVNALKDIDSILCRAGDDIGGASDMGAE